MGALEDLFTRQINPRSKLPSSKGNRKPINSVDPRLERVRSLSSGVTQGLIGIGNRPSVTDDASGAYDTGEGIGILSNVLPFIKAGVAPLAMIGALGKLAEKKGISTVPSELAQMFPSQQGVIKPKGGNWLSGSVEDALKELVPKAGAMGRSANSVMDEMLRTYPVDKLEMMSPDTRATVDAAFARLRPQVAVQNWIEGPLTKYVKTRMASPDDEVRKLAESGVLHVDPNSLRYGNRQVHPSGEHLQKLAQNPDALKWENAADFAIYPEQARTFKNSVSGSTGRPTIERNPWLANLPDDAPVYDLTQNMATQDLGFPHLIDELSNALNPNSGLPRHLLLNPDAMNNLSMEKAVRRVAEINAWRAAQKVEANRKLAEQASIVREYAENNPKGLRWVELKAPENLTPEQQKYYDKLISVQTDPQVAMGAARKYGTNPLADQLKYEGDVMGHCVGGYCDDVLSGRSRIFSLRDAKGEPHVTVEVDPSKGPMYRNLGLNQQEKVQRMYQAAVERGDINPKTMSVEGWYDNEPAPPRIVQIKGKQNRAPNPEYLPFVQDFVKNPYHGGRWSDVGDLQNTGLRKTALSEFNIPEAYYSQEELSKLLGEAGVPEANISGHLRGAGFAEGGIVRTSAPRPDQQPITGGVRGKIQTIEDLQNLIQSLSSYN